MRATPRSSTVQSEPRPKASRLTALGRRMRRSMRNVRESRPSSRSRAPTVATQTRPAPTATPLASPGSAARSVRYGGVGEMRARRVPAVAQRKPLPAAIAPMSGPGRPTDATIVGAGALAPSIRRTTAGPAGRSATTQSRRYANANAIGAACSSTVCTRSGVIALAGAPPRAPMSTPTSMPTSACGRLTARIRPHAARGSGAGRRSAPAHEAIATVREAVDVLELAVGAAAAVLERHGHGPASERDAVAAEARQQGEAGAADAVDPGGGAERGRRPGHERDLTVASVAEAAGAHPRELVAAHRAADLAVGDHVHRQPGGLDEGHSPRCSAQRAPVAATPVDVDDEPVAAALRPADDASVHRGEDGIGDGCRARDGDGRGQHENRDDHESGRALATRRHRSEDRSSVLGSGLVRVVRAVVGAGVGLAVVVVLSCGATAASAALRRGASCPMSHVHYTPYSGVERGLGRIPWIATSRGRSIKAHLFYYEGMPWGRKRLLGARIFTTRRRRNINPKVLWVIHVPGGGPTIRIRGRRLDGPGAFAATYPAAGPDYPSYVEVPHAGCWRVTVTSGRLTGSVVFAAVD